MLDDKRKESLIDWCEKIYGATGGARCVVSQNLGWPELKEFPQVGIGYYPPELGPSAVYCYKSGGDFQLVAWKNKIEGYVVL